MAVVHRKRPLMLRHIAWFNEAPVEPSAEGDLTSEDATVCRRCLIPARELEKLGVECSVFGNLQDADPLHVSKHLQKLATDIVVIGRMSGPTLLKLARTAKQLGCYVVADFGDEAILSDELIRLADIADLVVTTTPAMADIVQKRTDANVAIILDCEEGALDIHAPETVAQAWLTCLGQLKKKPPLCANSNMPAG